MSKPTPLPNILQTSNHDCATAAWRCVLQYQTNHRGRVSNLSSPVLGTDPSTLEAVIRRDRGWNVTSGEGVLSDLKHYADTLRPPICLMTFPGDGDSHYVTVGGVWRGRVFYQDPEPGRGWQSLPEEKFDECWHGLGRLRHFKRWLLAAWPA